MLIKVARRTMALLVTQFTDRNIFKTFFTKQNQKGIREGFSGFKILRSVFLPYCDWCGICGIGAVVPFHFTSGDISAYDRDGNLDQSFHSVLQWKAIVLYCISDYQFDPAWGNGGLCDPVYRPLPGEEGVPWEKGGSIVETIADVTASILTSGTVLTVVGFLLGIISTHGLLSQLGYLLGKGTICSVIAVFFVLPGLLYVMDRLFIKKKKGGMEHE